MQAIQTHGIHQLNVGTIKEFMSGNFTKESREDTCKGCKKTFIAKRKTGQFGFYQEYCKNCSTHKVWLRSDYRYISDEGVVIK